MLQPHSTTYILSLVNYYDSQRECYKKIITIDREPNGNLKQYIKRINQVKLSPFKGSEKINCLYAILNPNDRNELICIEKLPVLFSWLVANGYVINTSVTNMFQKSDIKLENKMICFINE
jgi:hypothetical protein